MSNQFQLAIGTLDRAKVWDIEPGRSNSTARSAAKGTDTLSLIVMGEMSRPHARSLLSVAALLLTLVLIGSVFDAKQLAAIPRPGTLPQTKLTIPNERRAFKAARATGTTIRRQVLRRCIADASLCTLFVDATPAAFGFVALTTVSTSVVYANINQWRN